DLWRRQRAAGGLSVLSEPACQTGCAHCCYQHVAISGVEALVLADFIRDRWPAEAIAGLRERLEREAERYRRIAVEADSPEAERAPLGRIRRPCPMLEETEGRCLAYEARPVNCRRENSVDVE